MPVIKDYFGSNEYFNNFEEAEKKLKEYRIIYPTAILKIVRDHEPTNETTPSIHY
jgi:hypothetical protein